MAGFAILLPCDYITFEWEKNEKEKTPRSGAIQEGKARSASIKPV